MDKDALRKQLYEELYSQFDGKLREVKRQKAELEEEIESSSEKWRNERRRLNSEIDRLESALGDARDTRRKTASAKISKGVDPQEIAKVQAAADEKLEKAHQGWEAEREKLQAEISRLQGGIAELIERSNNPLRANQAEKEKLETKLEEALRAKRQAEEAVLAAKSEWERERLKLVGDVVKLGRSAGQTKGLRSKSDEDRVEQLERRLQEAAKLRDGVAGDLKKAQGEAQALAERLDEAKAAANKQRVTLEKQLKDASSAREKLERELEKAKQAAVSLKASQTENAARLKDELEEARAEVKLMTRRFDQAKGEASKERAGMEKQLRDAVNAQEKLERDLSMQPDPAAQKEMHSADIAHLTEELEEARKVIQRLERRLSETKDSVSSEVVEQLRRQYDNRIQEMIRQKTQISEELKSATSLLESERRIVGANGDDAPAKGADGAVNTEMIDAEVARVQEMIITIAHLIDNPETELSTVIRKNVERAELDAYLKGILFSLGRGKGF